LPKKLPIRFLTFCLEAEIFDVKGEKMTKIKTLFNTHFFVLSHWFGIFHLSCPLNLGFIPNVDNNHPFGGELSPILNRPPKSIYGHLYQPSVGTGVTAKPHYTMKEPLLPGN